MKGYKKERGVGQLRRKKKGHADTSRRADWVKHYNPVFVLDRKLFAIVKWRGKKQPAERSLLEAGEKVSFVSCGCHKPDWI